MGTNPPLVDHYTAEDEAVDYGPPGSLHRPDCDPDCSEHHQMPNEAPYGESVGAAPLPPVADEKPAIYAYPASGRGENTPLFIPGWNNFALSRSNDYERERQRFFATGFTPRWLGPFTMADGRIVKVRPAPCGSGCYCAAEYKVVRPRKASHD